MAYMKVFRKLQDVISATNFPTIYLKPKQIQVFESILNHSDVIAVLPTGYGKSCLFQLLPGFLQQSNEQGIVIVLSPLNSIIIDQLNTLKKLNIKAGILKDTSNSESSTPSLFSSLYSEADIKNVSDDVKNGCVEVLFSHPEALLSDTGKAILKCETYQKKVAAVVIDEAHCIENWYDTFLWS